MAEYARQDLITLTANIVAAHLANNVVATGEVPPLLHNIYSALADLEKPATPAVEAPTPAVSVRTSIKPNYLVCLEDGRKLTMLKRYLARRYAMTPDQYRAKWNLPVDYPMVAPNYAERRRTLAREIGLGRKIAVPLPEPKLATRRRAKATPEAETSSTEWLERP